MARSFNGSSDLIQMTMPAGDTSPNINVGCWFNTTGAGALICSDTGTGSSRWLQFKVLSTHVTAILFANTSAHTVTGTAVVNDGAWHQAVLSYDGTTMRLYTDGVPDGTLTSSPTNTLASRSVRIGAQLSGVTQAFFTGPIAEAFIRYSAITAGEALSLANGLPASHLAPNHYWPLWGADSPEPDIGIGTHVTGVLTGTAAANGARVSVGLV